MSIPGGAEERMAPPTQARKLQPNGSSPRACSELGRLSPPRRSLMRPILGWHIPLGILVGIDHRKQQCCTFLQDDRAM